MIPPTSIDGTDITSATIDGTDVQEITVDGDVVFSATPAGPDGIYFDDFDDGKLQNRDDYTTTPLNLNLTQPTNSQYGPAVRPEWTIDNCSVSNMQLQIGLGGDVTTTLNNNDITVEFTLINQTIQTAFSVSQQPTGGTPANVNAPDESYVWIIRGSDYGFAKIDSNSNLIGFTPFGTRASLPFDVKYTYDGVSTHEFFVNGVQEFTTNDNQFDNFQFLRFGAREFDATMVVDDLMVY